METEVKEAKIQILDRRPEAAGKLIYFPLHYEYFASDKLGANSLNKGQAVLYARFENPFNSHREDLHQWIEISKVHDTEFLKRTAYDLVNSYFNKD